MGKVSDWLIGMEEDAAWMSRDIRGCRKHGASNLRVYDEVHRGHHRSAFSDA